MLAKEERGPTTPLRPAPRRTPPRQETTGQGPSELCTSPARRCWAVEAQVSPFYASNGEFPTTPLEFRCCWPKRISPFFLRHTDSGRPGPGPRQLHPHVCIRWHLHFGCGAHAHLPPACAHHPRCVCPLDLMSNVFFLLKTPNCKATTSPTRARGRCSARTPIASTSRARLRSTHCTQMNSCTSTSRRKYEF